MENKIISRRLRKRLPLYLNYLKTLPEDSSDISAAVIAKALDMGHVQVRKDLAQISETGRCRTGRNRRQLMQDIEGYLNFTRQTGTIVIGVGKLGQALLDYPGFDDAGFLVMAGFDTAPNTEISPGGKPIYPMSRLEAFCKYYDVHVGIIAVPADQAQQVCNTLIGYGIHVILNFTPVHLQVPEYVLVQNQNFAVSLAALRMQLNRQNEEDQTRRTRAICG